MKKILAILILFTITVKAQVVGGPVTSSSTNTLSNKTLSSPTITGVTKLNSTVSTGTTGGNFWFDGGTGGLNGFNFFSDDPSNASYLFSISNTTNSLKYYADHGSNNWLVVKDGKNFGISIDDANTTSYLIGRSSHVFAVKSATSAIGGSAVYRFTSAAHTGQTASTEFNPFVYTPSSIQFSTGALARQRGFNILQHTVSFVGASTLTDGANFYIAGGIVAGTNATITNNSGLMIGGMTGTVSLGAGTANGYGLTVYAPTGATNNYAARFLQGNVGIGTSAPTFSLDVTGTGRFTGSLTTTGITNTGNATSTGSIASSSKTGGIGYAIGSGSTVTQATSRTTGVTINAVTGSITLFSTAGSATWQSFTVSNSAVAINDVVVISQRSGTDLYITSVTAVTAGTFRFSFATTGGTTAEAPVFNFAVIKGQVN